MAGHGLTLTHYGATTSSLLLYWCGRYVIIYVYCTRGILFFIQEEDLLPFPVSLLYKRRAIRLHQQWYWLELVWVWRQGWAMALLKMWKQYARKDVIHISRMSNIHEFFKYVQIMCCSHLFHITHLFQWFGIWDRGPGAKIAAWARLCPGPGPGSAAMLGPGPGSRSPK